MTSNFDRAFDFLMKWEGNYSNHPNDPGGETKFGISHASYPEIDIKHLTKEQAKAIYKKDYWDHVHGDEIHDYVLAVSLFDFAVNSGVFKVVSEFQKILGTKVDGRFGPGTLAALKGVDQKSLAKKLNGRRLEFYVKLANNPTTRVFLLGWLRRLFDLQSEV